MWDRGVDFGIPLTVLPSGSRLTGGWGAYKTLYYRQLRATLSRQIAVRTADAALGMGVFA